MKKNKTIFYFLILLVILIGSGNLLYAQSTNYETIGHAAKLPVFYQNLVARQTYPLSWTQGTFPDFDAWKQQARAKVIESFMMPPPFVAFDPVVIGEEDRGTYIARQVVLNITGDSRVLALLTVPKSPGPHPAVLLLHDHGGKFDIGKEKVIKPFANNAAKLKSATDWVKINYGGRFLGDELAKKGYVCMSVDMLNWSDRSGPDPDGVQQALASNMMHLGVSWPGLIAYEDIRAAEFLAKYESVDSTRVAAMGLSVGGFRTWQIAALSPHIAAGVSVCWMSTYVGLMVPGNNQTKGQAAYSMLHPGLAQYLDYPDVASIACPKPMMFLNGNVDPLFPLQSIKDAHAKMRKVWESQNAGDKLITKIYDSPHEFNLKMQADAFTWLDKVFNYSVTQTTVQSILPKEDISLFVYPNPVGEEATISYQLSGNSRVSVVLVDSLGRETVIMADIEQDSGKYQLALSTAGLSNATYLVRLVVNGEQSSRKLMVMN